MMKKLIFLTLITAMVLILDQLTKTYIHTQFGLHEAKPVIQGFFNITYVRNPGAAFGMLQGAPDLFRKIFFLSITPVALLALLYFLKTVREEDHIQTAALSMVFSGAIGNYIDRIRFEYVIDFLDFYIGDWHYPAFNVADSAIVVGVGLILYCSYRDEKQKA